MTRQIKHKIHQSRKLLGNPYAYLDGEGEYNAVITGVPMGVHAARHLLENQYAYLDGLGGYTEWPSNRPATQIMLSTRDDQVFEPRKNSNPRLGRGKIESIARRLQADLWRQRRSLLPDKMQISPLDMLEPTLAFTSIGYSVSLEEALGQYRVGDELFEVAGIVDKSKSAVHISRRFSPEIRKFTMAHELGHAIMHPGSGLHRDRALDGTSGSGVRETDESEADIFAAYFLLPEKQVRLQFEHRYLKQRFVLNEETAFALTGGSVESLQSKCKTLRDITRMLASAERFNGAHFYSMAKSFGVSIEAMAIRIEELDLVEI